jgi:hypothetical protein
MLVRSVLVPPVGGLPLLIIALFAEAAFMARPRAWRSTGPSGQS